MRAHLGDLAALDDLSFLDGPRPPDWNAVTAAELMHEADGLVAESGVSGLDPIIRAAAERCVESHRAHDQTGVMAACRQIRDRVTQLNADR